MPGRPRTVAILARSAAIEPRGQAFATVFTEHAREEATAWHFRKPPL